MQGGHSALVAAAPVPGCDALHHPTELRSAVLCRHSLSAPVPAARPCSSQLCDQARRLLPLSGCKAVFLRHQCDDGDALEGFLILTL